MFKVDVTVPRITSEAVAEFEASIPGVSTVSHIPVIETEEQAIEAGRKIAEKSCVAREFVSRYSKITETETGWDMIWVISGD